MYIGATTSWLLLGLLPLIQLVSSHGHGHGDHEHVRRPPPPPGDAGIHDKNVVQDAEHIKEHYEGKMAFNESEMTPEELEFHYFKLHDFDNNTMLDGLEIFKALTHLMPYEDMDPIGDQVDVAGKSADQIRTEKKALRIKYYTDIVDTVMKEDDLDDDGYLTYIEYVLARRRAEAKHNNRKKEDAKEDVKATDSG